MVRTKGRRLLACYHEAGHALTRWFFGHGIDRVVVLTVEEVLAGVMVENRKGVAIQCEGVCEGYDIHGFPYGPMLAPDYDEARQAEHVRHRAISRDMEFINCWAGSCAEAVHRKVSLVAVMMAGGDGDLEHFRTVLDAWRLDSRSPEGKAAWRFAETRAKALIRSPMGAAAIKSIAEALHERGELDGDEVAALCRDAYGGRECRFGAWTDHWPPTLAQIRAGHIPERRPVSGGRGMTTDATVCLIDGTAGARLPVKPAVGSPCNGCGWCCAEEPCGVAREYIPDHPEEGPCLALEWAEGRFACGMIRRPSHYMRLPNDWADKVLGGMIAEALGAGRGCDAEGP